MNPIKAYIKGRYYKKLDASLGDSVTVLDVGCWDSSILERLPRRFNATGLDVYAPIIEKSKEKGFHKDYIIADVTTVNIPSKSYDAVIAIEIVEHLEKSQSIKLVEDIETWASKRVMISTPNGFYPFHMAREDRTIEDLMTHKCGWTVKEFRDRGYEVRGLEGFKWMRDKDGFRMLSLLTSPIPYFFPELAFRILAVKKIDGK